MSFIDEIVINDLNTLSEKGLLRKLKSVDQISSCAIKINGENFINFSSNDYLGLSNHPKLISASVEATNLYGVGSGASRLISGNHKLYEKLETLMAEFKECESCVVFGSGFTANQGVITSLVSKNDLVILDKLDHASIIDGARLSLADMRIYPHRDMRKLEHILRNSKGYKKRLIITDGVFSMDGDIAPLKDILNLAKKYNSICLLDDAHGGFVLGKNGKGLCEHLGVVDHENLIQVGTFSKALGCLGGYVVGSRLLASFLHNKARSLIYSTALPASVLASIIAGIRVIKEEPELRSKLWENVDYFHSKIKQMGFNTMDSKTHIIPFVFGNVEETTRVSKHLFDSKIYAPAIRPPTVAKDSCRVRISLSASHTKEHLDKVLTVLRSV